LWLIGQYCNSVILIVPNILRTFSKTFNKEETQVKYQILNLGAKLVSVDPNEHNLLLFEYVLNLSKYDTNYDIRDKARLYRALILNQIYRFVSNESNKETIVLDNENSIIENTNNENANNENANTNNENVNNENNTKENVDNKNIDDNEQNVALNETEIANKINNNYKINILNSTSLEELLTNLQKLLFSNNKLLQNHTNTIEGDYSNLMLIFIIF